MIRFDAVSKRYKGAQRPAVENIDLEIGAGEFTFLVGASGSGKSSLLRLILREERPTTGEIHVLGQRLTTISTRKVPYFRRSLGVVFQDFRLLPNKTVHDNVAFTLQVIGKSRGFIQTTVPDVLATVGLADKAQNMPHELSGGEQQRVAIARAVVNKPAVLLADEPTGNLDPRTSEGIMQVLQRINAQGTTVVMATHDVTIVDRMQKRVVELVQGRIVRDELEASYVTSSIPLPTAEAREAQATARAAGPASWARPGGLAAFATADSDHPVDGAPAAPPRTDDPQRAEEPVRSAAGAGLPGVRPRTGPIAVPPAQDIWVRTDTGPVLQPGEHAPWRAAPVAPPQPADDADGRSLFFAAPVSAQRRGRGLPTGETPIVSMREDEPVRLVTDGSPTAQQQTVRAVARPTDEPADLDDTGDAESAAARAAARHRGRLPDHLDFVAGLGLRHRGGQQDDEVGPSS